MNISVDLLRTKAASVLVAQTSESPIFIRVFIFDIGSRNWLELVDNEELDSPSPFMLNDDIF
jgi:hypothetical protein